MTFFSQDVEDPTMVADGRSFFRGFYRRLGVVYAKVEEIQEMMPIHPSFQHKAIKVHMHLYLSMVKVPPGLAAPQLGSCASSGCVWRPCLGSSGLPGREAGPLSAQLLPRPLESAASKPAHFTALDHSGTSRSSRSCHSTRSRRRTWHGDRAAKGP